MSIFVLQPYAKVIFRKTASPAQFEFINLKSGSHV